MDCSSAAEHLSPLADGELQQDVAEGVRAHLQKCPRCHGLFQTHQDVKRLVSRLLPVQKAPPGLKSAILASLPSSRMSSFLHVLFARLRAQPFLASAVIVTAFLAVFASVILLMNSKRLPPLVREALLHHAEADEYPLEVAGADPTKVEQELRRRLNRDIAVPDLKAKQCLLLGFRQCPVCERPATEIRYTHPNANLSLFVVRTDGKAEIARLCKPGTLQVKKIDGQTYFYCDAKDGHVICWWKEDDVFLLTSTLGLPALFDAAREVRSSCERRER